MSTIVNRICWVIFGSIVVSRLSTLRAIADQNIALLDSYATFDWQCTDEDSRVNTTLLKERVSTGNNPIVAVSNFVKGIWIWVGIEIAIIFLGFCCICLGVALNDLRRNIKENCR